MQGQASRGGAAENQAQARGGSAAGEQAAAVSPERTLVGFHEPSIKEFEAAYLGRLFMRTVNGSFGSSICGQSRANAS